VQRGSQGGNQDTMGTVLGESWWSGLLSFGDIWNHRATDNAIHTTVAIRGKIEPDS
jgi:hypothetical protein